MKKCEATLLGAMPKDTNNARETGLGASYRFGSLVFDVKNPTHNVTLEQRELLRKKKNAFNNCLFSFGDPFDTTDTKITPGAVVSDAPGAEDNDDEEEKRTGIKKIIKKG